MKSAKTWLVSCTALALLVCHQSGVSASEPPAPVPKLQTRHPKAPDQVQTMPAPASASSMTASGGGLRAQGSSLSASGSSLSAQQSDFNIEINLSADVLFDFDKAELKPEADAELKKAADVIAQKGKGVILITGHTDGKGSDAYNLRLSLARAEAVKSWFIAQGLQRNYQTEGKGAANPVAPNTHADGSDNPEGRAKNRRVEIVVNKTATLGGQ